MTETAARLAILISGQGSNMRALVRASVDPGFGAFPALVISNRPNAPGLAWARRARLAAEFLDHEAYRQRADFGAAIHRLLIAHRIDIVALAGFMRVLDRGFVRRWRGRLLNIHPSLLPAYPGLRTHERVLADGCPWHGCSVHLVDEGVDTGPLLAQARLGVGEGETEKSLADRVLVLEHRLYPACVSGLARRLHYAGQEASLRSSAGFPSSASSLSSR